MKWKKIYLLFIIIITSFLVFSLSIKAIEITENNKFIQNYKSPKNTNVYNNSLSIFNANQINNHYEYEIEYNMNTESHMEKNAEKYKQALNEAAQELVTGVNIYKNYKESGEIDTAAAYENAFNVASTVASLFGPWGMVASGVINLGGEIFKMCMGGEEPLSAEIQMEDRLNQQFNKLSIQIQELSDQVYAQSELINKSSDKIINTITSVLENQNSKNHYNQFMNGSYGGFSYKKYKNIILGKTNNNIYSNTAYYEQLKETLLDENSSDKLIKSRYDKLYSSIIENKDDFYKYIEETNTQKSIVQIYYDLLSNNSELCENNSPEILAIDFAQELLNVEIMQSLIIAECNFYQLKYMLMNDVNEYYYDEADNCVVTKKEILNGEINKQTSLAIKMIKNQIIKDLVYIHGLKDNYVVETRTNDDNIIKNDLYEMNIKSDEYYNYLCKTDTIYMNEMSSIICTKFGLDPNDFRYEFPEDINHGTNYFTVPENKSTIQISYYYQNIKLFDANFNIIDEQFYPLGTGTEEDPFLITNEYQFNLIKNNMDKHYRLVKDIDFKNQTIYPIGYNNYEGKEYYTDFTGTFDGNGHTIKNLGINLCNNTGLFSIIGNKGIVSNLNLFNININGTIESLNETNSQINVGILTGINNGTIKYCEINSDCTKEDITLKKDYKVYGSSKINYSYDEKYSFNKYGIGCRVYNKTQNRNIYLYVGGISGINNKLISCCSLNNIKLFATSLHEFQGGDTAQNKNYVYLGGITAHNYGIIGYCSIPNTVQIGSSARSTMNRTTRSYPHIYSYLGGITYKTESTSNLSNIYSNPEIIFNDATGKPESNYEIDDKNIDNDYSKTVLNILNESYLVNESEIIDLIKPTNRSLKLDYEFIETNVFSVDFDSISKENLIFKINNKKIDYDILGIYNIDRSFDLYEPKEQTILLLLKIEYNEETLYLTKEIKIQIINKVNKINVINLNDTYIINQFSLENLILEYIYSNGSTKYETITSDILDEIEILGDISQCGKKDIQIKYKENLIDLKFNLVCNHGINYKDQTSGYILDKDNSKKATCLEYGYDKYICSNNLCDQVKYYYYPKTNHNIQIKGAYEPTCKSNGHTGIKYCVDCGEEFDKGKILPLINHKYEYLDDTSHICTNKLCNNECPDNCELHICNHIETHTYEVNESYDKIMDTNTNKWLYTVRYTYSCIEENCQHKKEEVYEDNDISKYNNVTSLIVTDGYALPGSNEVTIYIQLINNIYNICGANFGIRYHEDLKLISISDGNLYSENWQFKKGVEVSNGINFVCANSDPFTGDGYLLKLTFETPENSKYGDVYDINIVYSDCKDKNGKFVKGGFSIETLSEQKCFITKSGKINIVKHLPGDVDNNGVVNLVDALIIGEYLGEPNDTDINEIYANVNLSVDDDPKNSNITIDDMIALLKYLNGNYPENDKYKVLSTTFNLILNYNNIMLNENSNYIESIIIDLYDEENNILKINKYCDLGIEELFKEGYEFIGWSDKLNGENIIDLNNYFKYNFNQDVQTLYAQWERNQLIIYPGESTTNNEIKSYSYEDINNITNDGINELYNSYVKSYNLKIQSDLDDFEDFDSNIDFSIIHWNIKFGNKEEQLSLTDLINKLKTINNYGLIEITPLYGNPIVDLDEINKKFSSSIYDVPTFKSLSGININTNDNFVENILLRCKDNEISNSYIIKAYNTYRKYKIEFCFDDDIIVNENFPDVSNLEIDYNNGNFNLISFINNISKNNYKYNGWEIELDKKKIEVKNSDTDIINQYNFKKIIENNESNSYTIKLTPLWKGNPVKIYIIDNKNGYAIKQYKGIVEYGNCFTFEDNDEIKYYYLQGTNGDIIVNNETKILFPDKVDIYILWKTYEFSLNYNLLDNNVFNKDYSSCTNISSNKIDNYTLLANSSGINPYMLPTNNYYKFDGWYDTTTDQLIINKNGNINNWNGRCNKNLYARWSQIYNGKYIHDETSLKSISSTGEYHIVKDISLKEKIISNDPRLEANWSPIDSFNGSIDGHNNIISNLKFEYNSTSENYGEYISNYGFVRELTGTIKNIQFENLTMIANKYKDDLHDTNIGGVVGYLNGGTLKNIIINSATIKSDHYRDVQASGNYVNTFIGGFVGRMNSGTINNCKITGTSEIWGKAGKATEKADAQCYAGGIVGFQSGGEVFNCSRSDDVKVSSRSRVNGKNCASRSAAGGIVGFKDGGIVVSCTSTATNVSGEWDNAGKYSTGYSYRLTNAIYGTK